MSDNLNLKTITTIDPSPFKHLCVTIGELPSSFLESMSYYEALAWFLKYLEDTVVPAVNANGEATAELQALFIELKDFVDNYFDNLDVQEEINNKLDSMVEDGTLTALIGAYCSPRLDAQDAIIAEQTTKINTLENRVNADVYAKMDNIRKETYKVYTPVTLPSDFSEDIFTELVVTSNNEGEYNVDFDTSKYINTSTNTWYVAPDGSNSNTGTDAEHPFLKLTTSIMNLMTTGDTVIFKSGIYARDNGIYSAHHITKSLNLITDGGKAVLSTYETSFSWTQYENNTWYTTRSGVYGCVDIRDYEKGIMTPLTKLESLTDIDTTPNTWCQVGDLLYVHLKDGIQPSINNLALELATSSPRMTFSPTSNNSKLYFKNFTILGSGHQCIHAQCNGNNNVRVLIENCELYNTIRSSADGFANLGCKSICKNVKVVNIEKDAFNYHEGDGVQAYGVEINCSANGCGLNYTTSDYSNNGSTSHDSCKVIRFNGKYNYCSGGIVMDVNDAIGACYNCLIADSFYYGADAVVSHNATMYLFDCYFTGSSSNWNMETTTNSHIYYKNCKFDTKKGNVIELA